MALQVGGHCYATALDAAAPACASFAPVSYLSANQLTTIGCKAPRSDGTLLMFRSTGDTTGSTQPVTNEFVQLLSYPPCVEEDYSQAIQGIAGPFLALLVSCWALWKIAAYLGWSRHDAAS